MSDSFAVRTHLQGDLLEFLEAGGFTETPIIRLIRDLVCLLASYREEDVPLFPEVFVLSSVATISSLAPGTERVTIGIGSLDDDHTAPTILKKCAGLAVRGWGVYVAKTEASRIEFGLFRALRHTFATSAEESMADLDETPAILIRNRGRLVVEMQAASGRRFTASFTSARAAPSALAAHIGQLAEVASSTLDVDRRAQFQPYFARLCVDLLQHCHGTLLAVHSAPVATAPPQFTDGVWLQSPLNLAVVHARAVANNDANALADLQAMEALLGGMVNSDGVVVVGTDGTLLAYSVFLKPTEDEKKLLPDRGGGRRRTYELTQLPQLRQGGSMISGTYGPRLALQNYAVRGFRMRSGRRSPRRSSKAACSGSGRTMQRIRNSRSLSPAMGMTTSAH